MKKVTPLARLQRLIEIKQRDVKSNQLRLHKKKLELDQQLKRLKLYRKEYLKLLMERNIAPLQMRDTKRFLQQLETSIEDTKLALDGQSQSEQGLQSVAVTLKSQQKSIERRIDATIQSAQLAEDSIAPTASASAPSSREQKVR